jgi:hypothetical protein
MAGTYYALKRREPEAVCDLPGTCLSENTWAIREPGLSYPGREGAR